MSEICLLCCFLTATTISGLLPNCPIEVLRVKEHFYGAPFWGLDWKRFRGFYDPFEVLHSRWRSLAAQCPASKYCHTIIIRTWKKCSMFHLQTVCFHRYIYISSILREKQQCFWASIYLFTAVHWSLEMSDQDLEKFDFSANNISLRVFMRMTKSGHTSATNVSEL